MMENKYLKFTKKHVLLKTAIASILALASTYCIGIIAKPSPFHAETMSMPKTASISSDNDAQVAKYVNQALAIIKNIPNVGTMKKTELINEADRIADIVWDQYRNSTMADYLKGRARWRAGYYKEAKPYYQKLLNLLNVYYRQHPYNSEPEDEDLRFVKVPTYWFWGDYNLYEEKDYVSAIAYYKKCVDKDGKLLPGIEVCLEKVKKASETGSVANNKKPAARITYVPSEDMVMMAWGTGASYEEACNNANCNAINQVVSLFGNGTKDDCQIKGCRLICKFTQSDGSKKVATYSIIKTPMLNGGNSSDGSTVSFGGSKFGAKEKMMEKNKSMEMEILNEVLRQTKIMLPKMYTRRLSVSEPKSMTKDALAERLHTASDFRDIDHSNEFADGVAHDLSHGRRVTVQQWNAIYRNIDTWMNTANSSSLVKFNIKYVLNDSDDNNVYLLLLKALSGIGMCKEEIREYDKVNKHKTRFVYSLDNKKDRIIYCLRSSDKELLEWMNRYVNVLYDYYLNFDIVDNLGGRSYISNEYNAKIHRMSHAGSMTKPSLSELNNVFVVPLGGYDISKYDNVYIPNDWDETTFRAYFLKGTGLFAPYAVLCDYLLGYYPYFYSQLIQDDTSDDPYVEGTANERDDYGSFANRNKRIDFTVFTNPELSIQFMMPNAKMSEYTSFSIKDRTQQ